MKAVGVESPNKPRPTRKLTLMISNGLAAIERNYAREGSGPGSRFEGKLLEDVQAEWVVRMVRPWFNRLSLVQNPGLTTDQMAALHELIYEGERDGLGSD